MAEIIIDEFEGEEGYNYFPTSEVVGVILAVVLNDLVLPLPEGDLPFPLDGFEIFNMEDGDMLQVVYIPVEEDEDDEEDLDECIDCLNEQIAELRADNEVLAEQVMKLSVLTAKLKMNSPLANMVLN